MFTNPEFIRVADMHQQVADASSSKTAMIGKEMIFRNGVTVIKQHISR
jgi:hypothetical protein